MARITSVTKNGHTYHNLIEDYRDESGKWKTRHLKYLGKEMLTMFTQLSYPRQINILCRAGWRWRGIHRNLNRDPRPYLEKVAKT
jgi:hypothetical protein